MVTHIEAKQAKITKVKNNFINEKKSSNEYSVAFLMEGEKFRRKVQICLRTSFLMSALLRTHLAHRSISQRFWHQQINIAELVSSGFFLSPTLVFAAVRTHFARKNINMKMLHSWPSGLNTGLQYCPSEFDTQR